MARTKLRGAPVGDDGLCCGSVVDAPLAEAEAVELARVLGALADPARLRLLSLVAAQPAVCSCDLEVPLGKSQPTVSHHTGCWWKPGSWWGRSAAGGRGGE
jgi:ArsR family transcriptional regulator